MNSPIKYYGSFQDVLSDLNKGKRVKNLLFGNGFSVAFDPNIFSYNALAKRINDGQDEDLKRVFKTLGTQNFEVAMKQLKVMGQLVDDLQGDANFKNKILQTHGRIKQALIDTIVATHPENVFSVQGQAESCATFLREFLDERVNTCGTKIPGGHVFSTNYDLLLYWVVMSQFDHSGERYCDGFAYEDGNKERLIWGYNKGKQNIHYLHGTLPFFNEGGELVKLQYNGSTLIKNITDRVGADTYPLFVAAGTKEDKRVQISQSAYLQFCYEKLTQIEGSLVVVGFGFGENDEHIIDAINKAAHRNRGGSRLFSVYIGYFNEKDRKHIESIAGKFQCAVRLFPSSTAEIWNKQGESNGNDSSKIVKCS